ncbi:MAG: hypothetical protein JW937_05165 [Candidatus Omnitrophica bacterium]|nr:hypothetical protein [Candidatus Omnitrophota bacterium]
MLIHYFVALMTTAVTHSVLAIYVYSKGRRSTTNITFALYSLSIAWWSGIQAMAMTETDQAHALLLWRVFHVGVIFIPVFFTHFAVSLLESKEQRRKRWMIWASYATGIFFLLLNCLNILIYTVEPKFSFYNFHHPGVAYFPFFVVWTAWTCYGLYLLFHSYVQSTGEKKEQLRYFAWSMLIAYIGGAPNFLPAFNIEIPILMPYGTYAIALYAFATAYAIERHNLMDARVVLSRSVSHALLIGILTTVYLVTVVFVERIFQQTFGYSRLFVTILAVTLISVLFMPLRNQLQRWVDALIWRKTPDALAEENERLQEEVLRSARLRAVGTLAAGMAHEIKNPLTALQTFAEYFPEKRQDPVFLDKLGKILSSETTRMNLIVQQLLAFARPTPPVMGSVDIPGLLEETLDLVSNDLIKYGVKVRTNYNHETVSIQADPQQLKQVFLNLIQNAIQAMPGGGTLSLSAQPMENGGTQVEISDTGQGISKENLKKIWDPFFSTKDKGTGLGLSVVHGILKQHGAIAAISCSDGAGTTVRLEFTK